MYPKLAKAIEEAKRDGNDIERLRYEVPVIPPLKDEKKRYTI